MNEIKVVVAENNVSVGRAVARIIRSAPAFVLLTDPVSCVAELDRVLSLDPEVALIDLLLGNQASGLACIQQIATKLPTCRSIAWTGHPDVWLIARALLTGAKGFIVKGAEPEYLLEAMQRVHAGETWIDPSMSNVITRALIALERASGRLAPREREVFELVGEGATDRQIAAEVGIKEATVRRTIARIKEKLDLESRSEVVREAAIAAAKRQVES